MDDKQDIEPRQPEAKGSEKERVELDNEEHYRSPALAWISVALTLGAWVVLMLANGYAAMAIAAAAVIAGFFAMPGRSRAVRNLAITSVIAAIVLLVVLTAFIIVIKIGLAAGTA